MCRHSPVHPALRARADRRLGVFTATEALAAGYRRDEVRTACSSGRWVRLRRGVYVTAADLALVDARSGRHAIDCWAALAFLDRRDTVVSHGSAARLWGWPLRGDLQPTVRLTDPQQWRRGAGYLVNRAPLPTEHRTTRGRLPTTSPARTLVDCAREWDLQDAVVAMDAALLRGHVTDQELRRAAAAAERWPGASRAVRAVALSDGRAESPLETCGRLRVVGSGLPGFEPQVEIWTGRRMLAVVDGWYDEAAVAVEFDGQVKYTAPWRDRSPGQVLWKEKRREDDLRALGIRFLRLAASDLGSRWPAQEDRLHTLLATPGPAVRAFDVVRRARGLVRTV